MERLNGETNPNFKLTPIFAGDKLVWVPVIEYYLYDRRPDLLLAKLAIERAIKDEND